MVVVDRGVDVEEGTLLLLGEERGRAGERGIGEGWLGLGTGLIGERRLRLDEMLSCKGKLVVRELAMVIVRVVRVHCGNGRECDPFKNSKQ